MNSRIERYKNRKKNKFKKFMALLVIINLLLIGIVIVDNSFSEFMGIKNKRVFYIDSKNEKYTATIFGKNYTVEKQLIDNLKDTIIKKAEDVYDSIRKVIK
ncbi:hypothetical protein PV797_13665 [Clostridiaceae bacterium M8S5]|nr:hypothetical protein PV797_13665 [Clostridiaceae bacterium M8S5]